MWVGVYGDDELGAMNLVTQQSARDAAAESGRALTPEHSNS
jgi:hypothetical protein